MLKSMWAQPGEAETTHTHKTHPFTKESRLQS